MTDQEPYKSPVETDSKPKQRGWLPLILWCVAGFIVVGVPFGFGGFIYASVVYQAPLPPGTAVFGMPALAGLFYMVIVAPVLGLGALSLVLLLRRVFS